MNVRMLTSRTAGIVAFVSMVLFELFRSESIQRMLGGELPPKGVWLVVLLATWQALTSAIRQTPTDRRVPWTIDPPRVKEEGEPNASATR